MRALFDDAGIGDHHDAIGIADRASRCAITSVVRPCASSASDCWIFRSVCVSSADVASSRMRIVGFVRNISKPSIVVAPLSTS